MALRAKKFQSAKVEAIDTLSAKIQASKDFIFTDYRGMTVEQITALRGQLREKNTEYHVIKNNFARIAFEKLQFPDVSSVLTGPTAVAFTSTEANEIAKILVDFAKDSPVKLKGALVERDFLDQAAIEALSKLPGRNQLIAMFMAGLKSPVQKLAYTLVALRDKLEAGGPAEAPAKAEAKAEAPTETPAEATAKAEAPAETPAPEVKADAAPAAQAEAPAEEAKPAE
ncbi:MAG TPA: 50S ribosomal protein L10 [Spirochaetales bacterium]|nr:50S ribosomal protein L10 [Spirochaetales bacterium]